MTLAPAFGRRGEGVRGGAELPGLIPWYPGAVAWVAPQAPKAPAVPLPNPRPRNPVQHRQDLYARLGTLMRAYARLGTLMRAYARFSTLMRAYARFSTLMRLRFRGFSHPKASKTPKNFPAPPFGGRHWGGALKEQSRGRAPQTVVGRGRRIKEEGEGRREGRKRGEGSK